MRIIACDFDGTLCENKFPDIGCPKRKIIKKLKQEQQNGSKIILWSCRESILLQSAIKWCKDLGIVFDAVNDNLSETIEWMGYNPRKIYATEYWDDKGMKV